MAQLRQDHVILNAIRRYEHHWLPLVSQYDGGKDLEPPLDVHWVWHAHILAPRLYHADCTRLCGTANAPDHKLHTPAAVQQAKFEAKQIWDTMYPTEPFDVDFSNIPQDLQYTPQVSYNLLEATQRQHSFFYQVSLPHYQDERFLKTAIERYRQFIRLKRHYPREFLVPTYDVDWVWHTHMLSPAGYKKDTEAYFGSLLHHDDTSVDRSPGSRLSIADARTKELWLENYQKHFSSPGCMYRGENPRGKLHHFDLTDFDRTTAKRCGFRIGKIVVKYDKKKGKYFDAHFDIVTGSGAFLTQGQCLGKCKNSDYATYEWEPKTPNPKGLYQFDMDSLNSYFLILDIIKRGALKGLLPGKDHQQFRIELSDAIQKLSKRAPDDNGHLSHVVLDTKQEPGCHLYVHCALSLVCCHWNCFHN